MTYLPTPEETPKCPYCGEDHRNWCTNGIDNPKWTQTCIMCGKKFDVQMSGKLTFICEPVDS